MEKEFVTSKIASKLEELGFDEDCFGYYTKRYDESYFLCIYQQEEGYSKERLEAPLWQQAIDFLKEKYDIVIEITRQNYFDTYANSYTYQAVCNVYKNKKLDRSVVVRDIKNNNDNIFYLYKEAREQAILTALELIKEI